MNITSYSVNKGFCDQLCIECARFVTDGHFQKCQCLKACGKQVVRCDGLLYDLL